MAVSEAQKRAFKKYFDNNRLKLLEFLGNKCVVCGFTDIRALQFDHIKGGGYKGKSNIAMVIYYLKHLEEARQDLQILCANHNWIKRFENSEHRKPIRLNKND